VRSGRPRPHTTGLTKPAAGRLPEVCRALCGVGLRWTASAGKHRVAREDAVHAITNPVHAQSEFDEPRVPGHLRPTLFIGPPRGRDGPLLEVMVEIIPPDDMVVLHVMVARAAHLERTGRRDGIDEQ